MRGGGLWDVSVETSMRKLDPPGAGGAAGRPWE